MKYALLTIVSFILIAETSLSGQGFEGRMHTGMNASQVDGDDFVGYNKLGLHAGVGVAYRLKPNMRISTELNFSQRGSRSSLGFTGTNSPFFLNLNYFEVPIIFSIRDWYLEDQNYHKMEFSGGFSVARLFSVNASNIPNENFSYDEEQFRNLDLGINLGMGYRFTRKMGVSFRYNRSLFKVADYSIQFPDRAPLFIRLDSYFLNLRFDYFL